VPPAQDLTPVALGEGDVALGADDHVVEERDSEEISGLSETVREIYIGPRRRGIIRRVVMGLLFPMPLCGGELA
jgi:hypothetical protein